MPRLLGNIRGDHVVEDRPDMLQAIHTVRHGLLRRVGAEMSRDKQAAAMSLLDDCSSDFAPRACVDFDRRDIPFLQVIKNCRNLSRICYRTTHIAMDRWIGVQ